MLQSHLASLRIAWQITNSSVDQHFVEYVLVHFTLVVVFTLSCTNEKIERSKMYLYNLLNSSKYTVYRLIPPDTCVWCPRLAQILFDSDFPEAHKQGTKDVEEKQDTYIYRSNKAT